MGVNPVLSPNPVLDVRELLAFPFMVSALEAATIVALLAAIVGWYAVLRRQAFAAHTLSVMAFPGAAGASLAGLPVALGYYLACGAAGLAIAGGGRRSPARGQGTETALIGTVQTVGLAAGFVFLSLDRSILGGAESLLFGTLLGITQREVIALAAVAAATLVALAAIGRPLLYATFDPQVARAAGVPVAILDAAFLLILGLAIAAISQITGALLVFALLIAPSAAAQRLTASPGRGLLVSVALAVVIAWLGLAAAYFSIYPSGFYITSLGLAAYVLARAAERARSRAAGAG